MGKRSKTQPERSQFPVPEPYLQAKVEKEIVDTLKALKAEDPGKHDLKQIAKAIGEPYRYFQRAVHGSEGRDFLGPEQLGKVAAYFAKFYSRKPPVGWPILTFEEYDRQLSVQRDAIAATLRNRGK